MRFKDKVAIVTGAGSGIGRETALTLAREGASVIIAEINEEMGKKVAQEIEDLGSKALSLKVDVSRFGDTQAMAEQTLDRFGKIDILVSNAGIVGKALPTDEMTEEEWDRLIDVHLKGCFLSCKAVLGEMKKQRSGKIVTIGSDAAIQHFLFGKLDQIAYIAGKGGVMAFTKHLAVEMAPYGINVNCISPGFIETALVKEFPGGRAAWDEGVKSIPKGRGGNPGDIAKLVAFLVSDDADYITGQIISVSGGIS